MKTEAKITIGCVAAAALVAALLLARRAVAAPPKAEIISVEIKRGE